MENKSRYIGGIFQKSTELYLWHNIKISMYIRQRKKKIPSPPKDNVERLNLDQISYEDGLHPLLNVNFTTKNKTKQVH